MHLFKEHIEEILNFSTFSKYTLLQRIHLQKVLEHPRFSLNIQQLEILFGDSVSGGLINNLIEESIINNDAALKLGKILANCKESKSFDYDVFDEEGELSVTMTHNYNPTSIIKNIIGKLGDPHENYEDNSQIIKDTLGLIKSHVAIAYSHEVEQ